MHTLYTLIMVRKSGQSYLINMDGTISFNTPATDEHQVLFEEFMSEEQVVLDVYTAFDNDAIVQFTTNNSWFWQNEVFATYDEDQLFDHGAISKTVNAAYLTNRPYFFPLIKDLDDYAWKVTRKLHRRMKQGQILLLSGVCEDRVLADATTAGACKFEYIAKMDLACMKGRH